MTKYKIEVREEFVNFIEIEANSEEEAYLKARDAYLKGKVFSNEDTSEVTYWVREA